MSLINTIIAVCLTAFLLSGCVTKQQNAGSLKVEISSVFWHDNTRGDFPVEVIWPQTRKPVGLMLFSHGANLAPEKYRALTMPFARAGYVVAAPLHADSESWDGAKAEGTQQVEWRSADLKLSADRMKRLSETTGTDLEGLPLVAAGHSFGALMAQMLAGASLGEAASGGPIAIIAFSPPPPIPGLMTTEGWGKVAAPQLVVTGTADVFPPMVSDWRLHLASYEAATMPAFAFVAADGDHYFGNMIGRTEYETPPQTAGFDRAVDISLLFLAAAVQGDDAAMAELIAAPDMMHRNIAGE